MTARLARVAILLAVALAAPSLAPAAADAPAALAWSQDGAPGGGAVQGLGVAGASLVASTFSLGAMRSLDGGRSWMPIAGFPAVTKGRVATDPTDPDVAYVAGFGGVARTTDGGASWQLVLAVARAARVDVGASGKVLVGARYADASNHVLVSADRGASWTDLAAPLPPNDPICGVAFGRSDADIMTMTNRRSWHSADAGASWTETPGAGFEFGIEDDGTVWRADVGLLQRTTDGGASWRDVPAPGFGTAIGAHPAGGVYVATSEGLALTRNGGASWTTYGYRDAMAGSTSVLADPADPDAAFVADEKRGVARLAASGPGFTFQGRTGGFPPVALRALGGSADGALLLAAGPTGAFASRDGGATWAHTGAGIGAADPRAVAAGAGGAVAYVAGANIVGSPVVEVLVDGRLRADATPLAGAGTVTALAVDDADASRAFAAVVAPPLAEVYETRDAGESWTVVLTLAGGVTDLAWHGASRALLAATDAGVLALVAPGAWAPAGAPAARVASAGGVAFASGASGVVARGEGVLPAMAPWALAGADAAALAAYDGGAWLLASNGMLLRCEGAALAGVCVDVPAPPAPVRALHASSESARLLAAGEAGLWRADA